MEPYQNRVVDEAADLRDRIQKLSAFILTGAFSGVAVEEQSRMRIQLSVMQALLLVLNERLAYFERLNIEVGKLDIGVGSDT